MVGYDIKNIVIIPTVTGEWTMASEGDLDVYGVLCDEHDNWLAWDYSNGTGNNFKITCTLQAGETYILRVRTQSLGENIGQTSDITVILTQNAAE